jgi:chromosome segregation ATPase
MDPKGKGMAMKMTTAVVGLVLAVAGAAPMVRVARAQTPPAGDVSAAQRRKNEGLIREMTERYNEFKAAHNGFDSAISSLLKRAAASGNDAEKRQALADLCSSALRTRLDHAIGLLREQLDAQSRYYGRAKEDAEKDVEEENRVIGNRREMEKQRLADLETAEKEMQFVRDQYTETERTRESAQGNPERLENLEKALQDLSRAIRVREDKVNTLRSAEEWIKIMMDSLEQTRQRAEGKVRQNLDSLALVESLRVYYDAYYSMRGAQIRQFCLDDGPTPEVMKD